ncbi:hypothetical protein [Streptomyces malaysiensis]|uniref:hypothetical protein n=1 Tax=Streptomyces malaysiensis TaxID=92644 RepID=UPI0037249442
MGKFKKAKPVSAAMAFIRGTAGISWYGGQGGHEVRSAEGITPKAVSFSNSEVEEAMALMDAIGGTDISQYRDQYRVGLPVGTGRRSSLSSMSVSGGSRP